MDSILENKNTIQKNSKVENMFAELGPSINFCFELELYVDISFSSEASLEAHKLYWVAIAGTHNSGELIYSGFHNDLVSICILPN